MSHSFALYNGYAASVESTRDTGVYIVTMLQQDDIAGMAAGSRFVADTDDTSLSLSAIVSVDYVRTLSTKRVTIHTAYPVHPDTLRAIAYTRAGETSARCFGASVDASDLMARVTIHTD